MADAAGLLAELRDAYKKNEMLLNQIKVSFSAPTPMCVSTPHPLCVFLLLANLV